MKVNRRSNSRWFVRLWYVLQQALQLYGICSMAAECLAPHWQVRATTLARAMQVHGAISLRTRRRNARLTRQRHGQATVEAAFALPVLFFLALMLVQPGIVLYDRMVMEGAAAEGCRLLATSSDANLPEARVVELIKRRLGAVPEHEVFHVHSDGCSWDIQLQGDESSQTVSVRITNRVKLLPLLGTGAGLLGAADARGCIRIEVMRSATTQPAWAAGQGISPSLWAGDRQ